MSHYDYRLVIIKHLVNPHFAASYFHSSLGNSFLFYDHSNQEICLKEKKNIEPDKC